MSEWRKETGHHNSPNGIKLRRQKSNFAFANIVFFSENLEFAAKQIEDLKEIAEKTGMQISF